MALSGAPTRNPAGPYPGVQIFIGSVEGDPAFAYLVNGRAEESRQRYVSPSMDWDNALRIKPIGNIKHDRFRHYRPVVVDPDTGLAVVSNSRAPIDALFDAYKYRTDEERLQGKYLKELLTGMGPEFDSRKTSRIVGVVFPVRGGRDFAAVLGITPEMGKAYQRTIEDVTKLPQDSNFVWVASYSDENDCVNPTYKSFGGSKLENNMTGIRLNATTRMHLRMRYTAWQATFAFAP